MNTAAESRHSPGRSRVNRLREPASRATAIIRNDELTRDYASPPHHPPTNAYDWHFALPMRQQEGAKPKLRAPPVSTTRERQPSPHQPISLPTDHGRRLSRVTAEQKERLRSFWCNPSSGETSSAALPWTSSLGSRRGAAPRQWGHCRRNLNAKPHAVADVGPRRRCKQPLPEANFR